MKAAVPALLLIKYIFKPLNSKNLSCSLVAVLLSATSFAQEQSSDRVEELTISATRLPRTIENIAGTVSLISAEDIEREVGDDLDDLVRFQPGVSMNTAARGRQSGFYYSRYRW